jgi:ATP-dependent helicase HepA
VPPRPTTLELSDTNPYHARFFARETALSRGTVVNYVTGQRFICDAEPELGLGQVIEVSHRTLTLAFVASETTRQYAMSNSPLTRVSFEVGDPIKDRRQEDWEVIAVNEHAGLFTYQVRDAAGNERSLPETELSAQLSLSQPLKRLLTLQTENASWFQLRRAALESQAFIDNSTLLGLCSARTDLLPHQLYIAHEVARRPAPRVLLSDEVGLGKTIEAGLILQQQLFSGLVRRVLIVVPDSLVHQWLVELLRRFNLRFTILDEERCEALTEVHAGDNPFDSDQLVLCSRQFLVESMEWSEAALESRWDLMILDEAHHVLLSEVADEPELIARFTSAIPGVLLLTATPDQLGMDSYFTLLRLLDPDRFHSLAAFQEDQRHYQELAALLDPLLGYDTLKPKQRTDLLKQLQPYATDADLLAKLDALRTDAEDALPAHSRALLDALLDRHGTGRIVFRNTRRQVSGFPARCLHEHVLALPEEYAAQASDLMPEQAFLADDAWIRLDPRTAWLHELLRQNRSEKFLLICHHRTTAESLEAWLRLHKGVQSAVFHEGLSLVERDRAAAWFAEREDGAQLLVCSEIGSEGRNFQFSHHLVLFDLPRHPDLLEQRIGRLDRIGQRHEIQLHVPHFQHSAGAVLLQLYRTLGLFTAPNPVAAQVCHDVHDSIETCLHLPADAEALQVLIKQAEARNAELLERHLSGRDRLLELNSCRADVAQALVTQLRELETAQNPDAFLRQVFANYGLDADTAPHDTRIVRPSDDMLLDAFPLIPDEGLTYTLDRAQALRRDDLPFVTWLHPLVLQSLDLVLQAHQGKATVGLLRDKRLTAGTLVLESLYRVTVTAPAALQAKRWFPATVLRSVVDSQKRSIGRSLTEEQLDTRTQGLDRQHIRTLVNEQRALIQLLARLGKQVVDKQLPELIAGKTEAMQQELSAELERLRALAAVNPQVRQEELDYLERQRDELTQAFATATVQLDALRLVLAV